MRKKPLKTLIELLNFMEKKGFSISEFKDMGRDSEDSVRVQIDFWIEGKLKK